MDNFGQVHSVSYLVLSFWSHFFRFSCYLVCYMLKRPKEFSFQKMDQVSLFDFNLLLQIVSPHSERIELWSVQT